jgi:uncharacterized protein with von Willebrand factor type A (vWA) domain
VVTPADTMLLGFAAALRAAGVGVTADRTRTYLEAVRTVGVEDRDATYWAGRATLCSGRDDFHAYDQVFDGWFTAGDLPAGGSRRRPPARVVDEAPLEEPDSGAGGDSDAAPLRIAASDTELLRHRDIASLDKAERARLAGLFDVLDPRPPRRPSYRHRPAPRGAVDPQATLRRTLRQLGEPAEIARRGRSVRPRRVVLLVDVSGSMSRYADALLRLAHRMGRPPVRRAGVGAARGRRPQVETFSVGTRVTRLTTALQWRDVDQALVAAGEAVPDWSGGTRLGESLQVFLDRWGQRGLVRGAVVVIFSDGWERGDAALLAEQTARLQRLAHTVVWVNPHKGAAGYQPVQAGMAAALPHVDEFVAGHSMAAFAEVLEVVARA